ncbi:MAG: hypothetical protein ACXVGH_08100 [Mycobacteriales bacterium]
MTAAVAAGALLTGCGSTVQLRSTALVPSGEGPAAGSLGAPGSAATGTVTGSATSGPNGASVPAAAGATGGGTGGGVAGPAAGTAGPGAAVASAAALPAGGIPLKGPGWDATHVYFGVVTQSDAQKAFASFGATNIDPGDTLGQANAVAAWVNAHGGVLGRTLVVVPKDVATVDTATNPEAAGSAVCTYFTQDHPVIGVLSVVTLMDYPNFRACLAQKHVPLFSSTVKLADDQGAADLAPNFTQTLMASWTRLAPVLVTRLKAQGWFSPWNTTTGTAGTGKVKVGVVTDSTAAGKRTGKLLQSELARAGYPGALVFSYAQASDGQSSSVNYFNQNGVTHVIVTDVELLAFESAAQNQGYKPRYGITSYNAMYTNVETSALTPKGANNGAMGVGLAPAIDVGETNDPGTSPGAAACRRIMTAGGQDLSGKRLAQAVAFSLCDTVLLVQQGAEAGHGLTGTALLTGMDAVAPRFPTAAGFSTALGSSAHYVPGTVRDMAWHTDCSCVRYGTATARL